MRVPEYAALGLLLTGCPDQNPTKETLTEPGRRTYHLVSEEEVAAENGTKPGTIKPLGTDDIQMTECSAKQPETSTEVIREEQIKDLSIRQHQRVLCWFKKAEGETPESQTILFQTDQWCDDDAYNQVQVVRGYQYNKKDPNKDHQQQMSIPTFVGKEGMHTESCLGGSDCGPRNYPDWNLPEFPAEPTVRDWLIQEIDPKDCEKILKKGKFPKGYWGEPLYH